MSGYWKCILTDKTVFDFDKHAECYEVCEEDTDFTAFFKYNKKTMEHITIATVRTDCILATLHIEEDVKSCVDYGYQE